MESQTPVAVDPVNHPKHYTSLGAKCSKCNHPIECIDITKHFNFTLGNAVKYLWRAPFKNKLEDLEKALWYLKAEISSIRGKSPGESVMKDIIKLREAMGDISWGDMSKNLEGSWAVNRENLPPLSWWVQTLGEPFYFLGETDTWRVVKHNKRSYELHVQPSLSGKWSLVLKTSSLASAVREARTLTGSGK